MGDMLGACQAYHRDSTGAFGRLRGAPARADQTKGPFIWRALPSAEVKNIVVR
jgi:hypothetical protein